MISVSKSALGIFKDCQACFWLDRIKKRCRPRGIFPGLPNAMDKIIKAYMDWHRSKASLPSELQTGGAAGLHLFSDQARLNKWRHWKSGMTTEQDGVKLIGALDDVLMTDGGLHVPFDYKTTGKEAIMADTIKYYQDQTNLYGVLLYENDMKVADFAIFSYWWPMNIQNGYNGGVNFNTQVIKIPVDIQAGKFLIHEAAKCLKGPMPPASKGCEYCEFVNQREGQKKDARKLAEVRH